MIKIELREKPGYFQTEERTTAARLGGTNGRFLKTLGELFPLVQQMDKKELEELPRVRQVFNELFEDFQFQKEAKLSDNHSIVKLRKSRDRKMSLRPHQLEGVSFAMKVLERTKNVCLLDQEQTGKTAQMAKIIDNSDYQVTVILELGKVKGQLCTNLVLWCEKPVKFFVITNGRTEKTFEEFLEYKEKKVLITTYEFWSEAKRVNRMKKVDLLIMDEPHQKLRGATRKSSRSLGIKRLSKISERKLLATATIVGNKTTQLFTILEIIWPNIFTSPRQFEDTFFEVEEQMFGRTIGKVRQEKLASLNSIITSISLSRKREDVNALAYKPEEILTNIWMELDPRKKEILDEFYEKWEIENEEQDVVVDATALISMAIYERRLLLNPRSLDETLPDIDGKFDLILRYLKKNPNSKVLVFDFFTSYLKLLGEKLTDSGYTVGTIFGSDSDANVEKTKLAFANGEIQILLGGIAPMGTGHTLNTADTIFFTGFDYIWSNLSQAYNRMQPQNESQVKDRKIYQLITKDTIEEVIYNGIKERKTEGQMVAEVKRHVERH